MSSPTQRTLKHLRADGWPLVQVVEKWNPHAMIRQDLFGLFDVLAVKGDAVLGVQCCAGSGASARLKKMQGNPALSVWLAGQNRLAVIHAWRKAGARGTRKTWQLREVTL